MGFGGGEKVDNETLLQSLEGRVVIVCVRAGRREWLGRGGRSGCVRGWKCFGEENGYE